MLNVQGSNSSETLSATSGAGADYKYDGKAGNDVIVGSTGNDLILGGKGSDVLFGGAGEDTFKFDKFANAGDHDIITDFHVEAKAGVQDHFVLGDGVKITGLSYGYFADNSANGVGLANDSKTMDATLTLTVMDGDKHFDYTVTLLDVIKNSTWSLDAFKDYLHIDASVDVIHYGA